MHDRLLEPHFAKRALLKMLAKKGTVIVYSAGGTGKCDPGRLERPEPADHQVHLLYTAARAGLWAR